MRRAFPILLLLLVLLPAKMGFAEPRRDPMSLDPDSVVATVNDDIILAREVQKLIGTAPGVPVEERLRLFEGQVANLVQHYLLKREAERFGIVVSRREIEQEIQVERERAESFGKPLEEFLAQQGMTFAEFQESIEDRLKIGRLWSSIVGKRQSMNPHDRPQEDSHVRPAELQREYRENQGEYRRPAEVRYRVIFIKTITFLQPGKSAHEARREALIRAEGIAARVAKGEEFAKLAREFSEGPHRDEGGDQGVKTKQQLPKLLREWAFRVKPGSVSEVLETSSGYMLVKLEERQPERVLPFEEVQAQIHGQLLQRRLVRNRRRVLRELVEGAEITPIHLKGTILRVLAQESQAK